MGCTTLFTKRGFYTTMGDTCGSCDYCDHIDSELRQCELVSVLCSYTCNDFSTKWHAYKTCPSDTICTICRCLCPHCSTGTGSQCEHTGIVKTFVCNGVTHRKSSIRICDDQLTYLDWFFHHAHDPITNERLLLLMDSAFPSFAVLSDDQGTYIRDIIRRHGYTPDLHRRFLDS